MDQGRRCRDEPIDQAEGLRGLLEPRQVPGLGHQLEPGVRDRRASLSGSSSRSRASGRSSGSGSRAGSSSTSRTPAALFRPGSASSAPVMRPSAERGGDNLRATRHRRPSCRRS